MIYISKTNRLQHKVYNWYNLCYANKYIG